ncbi:hypothetical protein [Chromohalobacter nigrandesensis]|uniref:hypothetical protein n=1 Tax=Chromohalobacter nigrandesensis TaxID=119863 RepID=UPI001FF39C2A|nr:hypothetical protein [Chromohalobacter nigrandesensis]MCK0743585.1 hypothetical protein [Chromohalobacter nigrandesensis]
MTMSQQKPAVRMDDRTFYEAKGDAMYSVRYMILQERLYKRLAGLFKFTSLFGGSAAFAGLITASPLVTGTSGLLITASTVLDFVISPEQKALQCKEARQKFQKLLRKADELDIAAFDRRAEKIAMLDTPNIESLRIPAYNDSMCERGRTDFVQPLSFRQRVIRAIA